jgi:lysophospholipase L1-like esterase
MLLRNVGKNILSILIGISISFVLFEGLLRIFQPIEYRVKGNKIKLPKDKKYHFINDKTDQLDKVISTSWNHMGFRGEMPPKNFSEYLTIIAIGGSTTECTVISDGKTWCDLLAGKIKEKFRPVWLGNGGLNGMSTYGHIISMEDYIIKIKPKVALFLVGANDIGLRTYRAEDLDHFKKPDTGWLASSWEKLMNQSEVLGYAINFYRYSKAKRMGLVYPILDFPHLKQVDVSPEQEQGVLREHQEKYLKPYAQRLRKLIELCRENGIEPVFITQPAVFGDLIDPATGTDLGKVEFWAWNGKVLWEILELYNGVLRDICRQQHVYVVDLAREMPKSTEYFCDSYHFTNAGCQRVAEIISRHLSEFLIEKYPQYALNKNSPNG